MQQKSTIQRHKTSVFSQYQNNSNNSVSSKQLEYWLLQMAPTAHTSPKFGNDWNLMSTSSRYQSDGVTFAGRLDTFQSGNKQNLHSQANLVTLGDRQQKQGQQQSLSFENQGMQKLKSSKSYINAMQDLQKRAKTLQQQNINMRRSIQLLQQQKRKTLQSSMVESQQFESKLLQINGYQKKAQQMRRENKKLRDLKNQQSHKLKLMQKSINEQKSKVQQFEQRLDELSNENGNLKNQLTEANNMAKSLMIQNKHITLKVDTLQNMKERSTMSVMQKYAKALERIQELQLTVNQLKNRYSSKEQKHKKTIQQKQAKHFNLLQSINELKLQKQRLSLRLKHSQSQLEQRIKQLQSFQEKMSLMQLGLTQASNQLCIYKKKLSQKQRQQRKSQQKYEKLFKKFSILTEKSEEQQRKTVKSVQKYEKDTTIIQNQNYQIQNDLQNKEEESPVGKYSEEDDIGFRDESEQANSQDQLTMTKPYSIVANAKNPIPLISSQKTSPSRSYQNLNNQNYESEQQEEDSLSNQQQSLISKNLKKVQIKKQKSKSKQAQNKKTLKQNKKIQVNSRVQQRKIQQKKSSLSIRTQKQQKQKQRTIKQPECKKQSLRHPKIIDNLVSTYENKTKKSRSLKSCEMAVDINETQSKSMSKKQGRKSTSMNSKTNRKMLPQQQTKAYTTQRQNYLIKSCQPSSQSRYINDNPSCQQQYNYNSATFSRYPSNQQPCYYYTNQINSKYHPGCVDQDVSNYKVNHVQSQGYPSQQYMGSSYKHCSAMVHNNRSSSKESDKSIKTSNNGNAALNKALLLQFQEEALKLYEQHQKLLELSQKQNISNQQRAQILGSIRQVMNMIDHNTEKIFSIKGRMQ